MTDFDLPARQQVRPVLVIDSREQDPLPIRRLQSVRAGLQSGDYSVRGAEHLFAVERKSVPDLVGSLCGGRERFERELHRLRGFRFARLLVVGAPAEIERTRSRMNPRSILASLHAFEVRYSVPVVWEADPTAAGELVERWSSWFAYDLIRAAERLNHASEP